MAEDRVESETEGQGLKRFHEPGSPPKHVFVIGFPRSGTTWMMWLLAQLPGVVALQQSGLFHALRVLETWWRRDHRFSRRVSQEDGCPGAVYEMHGSSAVVSEQDFHDVSRGVCDRVFDRIAAASPGTRMVVEQTPENLEFERAIRGVYPDASFLNMVRDPRDAYCSMRKASRAWVNGFPTTPTLIANRWVEYVGRARRLQESTDRCLQVRYEDLSAKGGEEFLRICQWLGLEVDLEACERAVEACAIDKLRAKTTMPRGFYGKGRAGTWRDELRGSELRLVEYIMGEEMERLGYERSHPRSRVKPWRLTWHQATAGPLGRVWNGLDRLTRLPRRAIKGHKESVHYTKARDESPADQFLDPSVWRDR